MQVHLDGLDLGLCHVEPESIWASAQICLAVWHVRLKSKVEDQSEKHWCRIPLCVHPGSIASCLE